MARRLERSGGLEYRCPIACAEIHIAQHATWGESGIDKNSSFADSNCMNADILATIALLLIMTGLAMLMLDKVLGKD